MEVWGKMNPLNSHRVCKSVRQDSPGREQQAHLLKSRPAEQVPQSLAVNAGQGSAPSRPRGPWRSAWTYKLDAGVPSDTLRLPRYKMRDKGLKCELRGSHGALVEASGVSRQPSPPRGELGTRGPQKPPAGTLRH